MKKYKRKFNETKISRGLSGIEFDFNEISGGLTMLASQEGTKGVTVTLGHYSGGRPGKINLNRKSIEKYKYFDVDYGMERYNIDQINEDLKQPLLLITTKYEKEILKMLNKF